MSASQEPAFTADIQSLSHVRLFATPWTIAHQAPLSTGFSRQEYWSELPFPSCSINILCGVWGSLEINSTPLNSFVHRHSKRFVWNVDLLPFSCLTSLTLVAALRCNVRNASFLLPDKKAQSKCYAHEECFRMIILSLPPVLLDSDVCPKYQLSK